MAADAPTRHGEAELLPIRIITLACIEVDAGGAQPVNGEVLKYVTDGEDAQRATRKVGAFVLRRAG